MKPHHVQNDHSGDSYAGGITDLMTSLAVIFILLLAAYVSRTETSQAKGTDRSATAPATLNHHAQLLQLDVVTEPSHPNVLSVVVPDAILNFELGKSALLPAGEAFLYTAMPQYALMLCGADGEEIESFVIEGHTDDLGGDLHNLKLSQERSFAVMVKGLDVIRDSLPWAYDCFQRKTSANGRGEQNPILDSLGTIDRERSRRVIFKFHLRHR
jgi:outer membrane protein OmpA-like peptidoglycan-associated protein